MNSSWHFGKFKNTGKMIEEDLPIWTPLTWKTNFALQGLFNVPYSEFQ